MNGIRKCETGKQCFSHPYAQREGVDLFDRCPECGYYHRKDNTATKYPAPPVTKESGPMRNKVPAHILQRLMIDNKHHSYAIEFNGIYRPIEAIKIEGVTATISFYDEVNGYGESVVGYNEAVNIEVTAIEPPDLMTGRRNDEQLLESVRRFSRTAGEPHNLEQMVKVDAGTHVEMTRNANFGLRCFDFVSNALGMLQSGEWAEQKPVDALLADFEVQIGELVARANRFEEIQAKYAAAVSTLESKGYSYRVEGAAMWAPPHGSVPDFILWERGTLKGMPPVNAQVVFDINGRIGTGKVVGIGQENIIIEEMRDFDGTEEAHEFSAELASINVWPYSQADHERAIELVEAMTAVKGPQSRTGSYYRLAFNLVKSGKV